MTPTSYTAKYITTTISKLVIAIEALQAWSLGMGPLSL